jgi:2-polyprenyl-3-methyl-5-hydroxy-6-metoxy-1,4-benzoquinol methylase
MEKLTDWNSLWRELVEIKEESRKGKSSKGSKEDIWAGRAVEFKEGVQRKWVRPDSSRDFILSHMDSSSTVLDIGAGTGAWSILLSQRAKHVTAVEPSPSMMKVMQESLEEQNIKNVSIVQGSWPDVLVEPHDFSLCSHAMYACPDLAAFVLKMAACTRRMCFLLLRAPSLSGVRAEAAQHIWGQPLDSPNFTIAYNILLQIGIYANVQMEDTGLWKPRTSLSLEEALTHMHRFLGLGDSDKYDAYLMDLLRRRLVWKNGRYVWPPEVRSALIYWKLES